MQIAELTLTPAQSCATEKVLQGLKTGPISVLWSAAGMGRTIILKTIQAATDATFAPVRKKIQDAGIELKILCYNMNVKTTEDDEIEYAFRMAKALGVDAISTSTQVSMAKRLAPFADKHKMRVGFHGHANTTNPDEVATPESFEAVMAASKYLGANLDVGL